MEPKEKRGGLKTYANFTPPSPYEQERRRAEQQRRYAELLQQQALAQEEPFTYQGIRAMPSPLTALTKMLQAYGSKKASEKAEEAESKAKGMEETAAQQISGRIFGGAPVSQVDTTPDESGLAEVAIESQYRQDPMDAMRIASTPQGAAAVKNNQILAGMLAKSMETPKGAEYGTTPQYDKEGRAFVVNKAGNVRYLQGVEAPAAAPAAVTPTTIMRNGRKIVVDARTGAEIGAAPSDALSQGPKETAEGLRKEFTGQTSQYRGVVDAFQKIKTAAMNPSAANDISLIFGFMKALDPTSTVREGEAATAENARGVSEDIRNLYNKVNTGQRLSQAQRQDFLQSAYGLVESQMPNAQEIIDRYSGIAGRAGLNAQDVVSDPFKNVRIIRLKSNNDPEYSALKSGDLYFSPDGVMRRKK